MTAANVQRLVDLLWEFDEKNPDDPSTWHAPQRRDHKLKELNNTGMLEIYNHQYLWDNRMEKRVYDAFVDIWDREDLWVIIDRAPELSLYGVVARPAQAVAGWLAPATPPRFRQGGGASLFFQIA